MIGKLIKIIGRHLLNFYKFAKQRSSNSSLDHCLQVARTIPHSSKYCFLISNGLDGWSSARFVEPIVDSDISSIWIGTNPNLRKIKEIGNSSKVTLAFGNKKEKANLIIYGTAQIETDISLRKRYWKSEWRLFFPNGPIGDDYVLIQIEPLRMELMSFDRNVILEPFGLKPAVLVRNEGKWSIETPSA